MVLPLIVLAFVAYSIAVWMTFGIVEERRKQGRLPWAAEVPIGLIVAMICFGSILLLGGLGVIGP